MSRVFVLLARYTSIGAFALYATRKSQCQFARSRNVWFVKKHCLSYRRWGWGDISARIILHEGVDEFDLMVGHRESNT